MGGCRSFGAALLINNHSQGRPTRTLLSLVMAMLMLSACSTVPTTPHRNGSIEPAMSEPSIKPADQAMSNGWIDPADSRAER